MNPYLVAYLAVSAVVLVAHIGAIYFSWQVYKETRDLK